MKTYFDGYNTMREHESYEIFSLVEYVKDKWYSGDGRVFAVRIPSGEDFANFFTMDEAREFYELCVRTYKEFADTKSLSEIVDIVIERCGPVSTEGVRV